MSPRERCAGTRLSLLKWRGAKSKPGVGGTLLLRRQN